MKAIEHLHGQPHYLHHQQHYSQAVLIVLKEQRQKEKYRQRNPLLRGTPAHSIA